MTEIYRRRTLGFFPTPISELTRLGKVLGGPSILIKRDDLSGLALGGNKVRKLEFLLGDALLHGCDTIISGGAEQSNHCRQTAAACAVCDLECHLVLGGSEPDPDGAELRFKGNLLLDRIFGARIHWSGEFRKGETIPQLAQSLRASGRNPYVIPYGGSNPIGALGFVEATRELNEQIPLLEKKPSHIVFASSSGGTHAGLVVGKHRFGGDYSIIGVEIDKGESGSKSFRAHVEQLVNQTSELVGTSISDISAEVILNNGYTGGGYGVVGELERQAIHLLATTEGILLDPVYTGRAFGGLIDMIKCGVFKRTDTVLFWHTGGTPALFA